MILAVAGSGASADSPRVENRRAKLRVWGLATVLVCGLLGGALFAARVIERDATKQAISRADLAAAAAAQLVQRVVQFHTVLTDALRMRLYLQQINRPDLAAEVEKRLASYVADPSLGLRRVTLIDPAGNVVWSSLWSRPFNLANRKHLYAALHGVPGLHMSRVLVGSETGQPSLYLSQPLTSESTGSLIGVGVAVLDPLRLSEMLRVVSPGPSATISLARREDGACLARSNATPGSILHLGTMKPDTVAALRANANLPQLFPADADESARFIGTHPVPGIGLDIYAVLDAEHELAPALTLARGLMLGALVMSLLVVLTAVLHLAELSRRRLANAYGEMERLLSRAPVVVSEGVIDSRGRYHRRYMTPNSQNVIGVALDRMSGGEWLGDHVAPTDAVALTRSIATLRQHDHLKLQVRSYCPPAEANWLNFEFHVTERYVDGSLLVVCAITNVTDQHAMATRMAGAAKMAALGEMATGLAHELNQPLAIMSMAAENAVADLADLPNRSDSIKRRLERISEQADRARKIVDHLRIFGHAGAGPPEQLDLARVVQDALILTQPALKQAGITLVTDLSSDLPAAFGHRVPMEQVLINLIMNARDALAGRADPARCVTIAARAEATTLELTVEDTGGGIPDELLPRVFEPFFTTKAPGEGTGLGLSICHTLVQEMGGSMSVENRMAGACFILHLPRADRAAADFPYADISAMEASRDP